MRKISALLFLLVLLLAQTPLQQLLKVPVLAAHFQEHRAENKNLSFTAYLVLHYLSGHTQDDDFQRDQQLPFRSHDVVIVSGTVVVPGQITADFTLPTYRPEHYLLLSDSHPSSSYACGIWQPPKTA